MLFRTSAWALWSTGAVLVGLAGWSALGGVILRVIWAARERQRAEWADPFAKET